MLQRFLQPIRRKLLDKMVLRPTQHALPAPHMERVMLPCGSNEIECFVQKTYDDPRLPDLLILKFPGTAGRAEHATAFPVSMLDVKRAAVWTWNPPGYGNSTGQSSLSTMACAASDFYTGVTKDQARPQTTIWLCGNSLGCASVLHIAATHKPNPARTGLILRNPPPLRHVIKRAASRYPHLGLINPVIAELCDSMDTMKTACNVDVPAVVLQSELDTLVPVDFQNEILKHYRGPFEKALLHGIGHDGITTEQHEPLISNCVNWLWQQTGSNEHP